jgi:hypothetical protein
VAILYFLADEPVQNHQQQDCRLIVEVHAPDGADIQWVHAEAEIAMKEKFGEGFALKPTTEQAASKFFGSGSRRHLRRIKLSDWSPTVLPSSADSLIRRAGRRPLKSAVQGLHHSLPFHALSVF